MSLSAGRGAPCHSCPPVCRPDAESPAGDVGTQGTQRPAASGGGHSHGRSSPAVRTLFYRRPRTPSSWARTAQCRVLHAPLRRGSLPAGSARGSWAPAEDLPRHGRTSVSPLAVCKPAPAVPRRPAVKWDDRPFGSRPLNPASLSSLTPTQAGGQGWAWQDPRPHQEVTMASGSASTSERWSLGLCSVSDTGVSGVVLGACLREVTFTRALGAPRLLALTWWDSPAAPQARGGGGSVRPPGRPLAGFGRLLPLAIRAQVLSTCLGPEW